MGVGTFQLGHRRPNQAGNRRYDPVPLIGSKTAKTCVVVYPAEPAQQVFDSRQVDLFERPEQTHGRGKDLGTHTRANSEARVAVARQAAPDQQMDQLVRTQLRRHRNAGVI